MRQNLTPVEKELSQSSERLLTQFRSACARASLLISPEELATWTGEGLALSRYFPPLSLEAAEEYFRVTPEVLDILPFPRFLDWTRRGKTLCRDSPSLATAYFQASPRVLAMLPERLIEVWLEMGPGLYRNTPESIALACSLFAAAPELLQSLSLAKMGRFTLFLNRLARTSHNLAAECLSVAPQVLAKMGNDEREPFLAVALTLVRLNPGASATYFKRGAEALVNIAGGQRRRFLSLAGKIAQYSARRALSLVFECSQTFSRIDSSLHSRLLNWSETVLAISATAGIKFLKNCPAVLEKTGVPGLGRWFEEGVRLLKEDEEAGLAHFRLESTDERALERLVAKVGLDQVYNVLLMYGQALAGTRVDIRSSESLAEWSMGSIQPGTPTTDGATIFLPLSVDRYDSEKENFAWYKAAVTHQAGHIEFGTFNFCFEKEAVLFPNRRHQLPSADGAGLADMERFFSLFDDRKLSVDIFSVVEDIRVDYLLEQEYAGIRRSYQWFQQESLSRRPPLVSLPMREAFLEILIQMSLGGELPVIPRTLRGWLESALEILRRVQSERATVEDSAEATIRLYEIISAIPNQHLPGWQWRITDLDGTEFATIDASNRQQDGEDVVLEPGIEVPYQSPTEVEFRGDSHPELLRLLFKLKDDPDHLAPSPVSPSAREIQLTGILRGKLSSSGLYVTDLPAEAQAQENSPGGENESKHEPRTSRPVEGALVEEEGQSFLYDEWNFHAGCYLPKWCRVREKPLDEESADFFEETLSRNSLLANQIRKQFEMLAPELRKKFNKLYDGEEIDLDAVVKAVVERKAGHISDEKIYWKRRKVQRDVAAILLLDMSASTGVIIKEADDEEYPDWYLDLIETSPRLRVQGDEVLTEGLRRVIDVAKESVVLMINALEVIGDCYGVYGFSGRGRENVELLVIKGMDEEFSGTVKRRIGSISPLHGTRMGPAIRHTTSKLEACDAKTKILFLVSDGYPQDEDYGQDNNDREYALQDTRMAFFEAKRKNIIPFCLTVDIAGYDYLKRMCHDIDYEVVNNIESLPQRLPILYKRLTS